jgi:hypothetical protein
MAPSTSEQGERAKEVGTVFDAVVVGAGFAGLADVTNEAPKVRLTERWRVPLDIDVISPAAVAARRVPVV